MQVSEVAHGGEALRWFGEKQIYSFATPHIRSGGNKGAQSHAVSILAAGWSVGFCRAGFHTNSLRVKAVLSLSSLTEN